MAKVVYMLGAGASSKALPVVNEMGDFLEVFASSFGGSSDDYEIIRSMIKESRLYSSPDTFARVLYLTKDKRYNYFNNLLGLAFLWKQKSKDLEEYYGDSALEGKIKIRIDPRYFSFFSALLDSPDSLSLPSELGFILWNYDLQIEESLKALGVKKFPKIVRLNDTANVALNGKILDSIADIQEYKKSFKSLESGIRYAWEKHGRDNNDIEGLLYDTEDLVIIGYSFPVYNRNIDRNIILNLQPKENRGDLKITIVGTSELSLVKQKASLESILSEFHWDKGQITGSAYRKYHIDTIVSPDQFPIKSLPIFQES